MPSNSTSTEPQAPSAPKSLEDRITMPASTGTNVNAASFTPGRASGFSWADDVDSPTSPAIADPAPSTTAEKNEGTTKEETLPKAQSDGAIEEQHGSTLQEPEHDVNVKLSDMQADPNNPLYSIKSFEELRLAPEILKGIYAMNFRKPSKIQERALPLLMSNPPSNLIGQSQSGTGKTAAFTLNMLSRVDTSLRKPQALVLAPSRELARQILGVVQVMGQFVQGLEVSQAIPDPARRNQTIQGQIVVGTPGTTMDMIRRRQLDATNIKVLVLDEADNMLDQQGLGDQCKRVKVLLPKTIQTVLFSATFPNEVLSFANQFAPNANQITLEHDELTVEGIRQLYLDCNNIQDKYDVLVKFYGLLTIASSIIFVKRRETARDIEERMVAEGHKVASLTGALEGAQRDAIIDRFRNGDAKVLIATNVLARGIDVQSVTMVINYDVPELANGDPDPETYLHRIGRTGRFGRVGVAITFIHDKASWRKFVAITSKYGIEAVRLDTSDWDSVEDVVKRVIKSSRAGTNIDMEM
ncbi:P-loop containing nucleoside triphosphate hydrolase protein [Cryomyces antarcticus]